PLEVADVPAAHAVAAVAAHRTPQETPLPTPASRSSPLAAAGGSTVQRVLLPEFDGVRGAGKLPSVGAFADVRHDDVVDEVVLELVVGELAGQPEFLDLVPVAPAAVDTQRCGPPVAALTFVVTRLDDAADLELTPLDVVGDRFSGDDGGV